MRRVLQRSKFQKDIERMKGRAKDLRRLKAVITVLLADGALPSELRPHKLSGEYDGLWECHLDNDWLLIYDVNPVAVLLFRTGTHDDLF